ncbi:hypothetical protein E8E13_000471 [Curvularia kusanoi]|uniref:Uncharacterized protein n=1 Tax=Curvularia kusanoi TaxID=90978 RepID=A0A9P4W6I6_CURKU|nr:hypothetical protein E8E13_000471 [Curvularia kusanoi]
MIASSAFQARVAVLISVSRDSKKLTRNATNKRNMAASAIKKIQIPAYCPVLWGVNDFDQSGVEVDTKKVIAIVSAPIIVIEVDEVEVGIDIAPVMVADIAVVIDMSIVSNLAA